MPPSQIILGLVAAPVSSFSSVFHSAFWLWLHLLQFDVANQIYGLAEDALNKAYRPLPAGRITLQNATTLRWSLFPLCTLVSALYSKQTLCASTLFSLLTFVYNELHTDAGNWLLRNAMNGIGLATLEWGTILLAGAHTLQSKSNTTLPRADVRSVQDTTTPTLTLRQCVLCSTAPQSSPLQSTFRTSGT